MIPLLHQQAAVDAFEVKTLGRGSPLAAFQQTHVLLGCHRLAGRLADAGGDDHLDELTGNDSRRSGTIQLAVEGDDAAKGGGGVGLVGAIVGTQQVVTYGDATGLACLTMTQAGSANSFTHSSAASVSAMLL